MPTGSSTAPRISLSNLPARDEFFCPGVAAHAVVRQLHRVRGPLQQAHAQRFFEGFQAPADRRLRRRERPRGGGQAAGVHDAHEGFDQHHTVGRWINSRKVCAHTRIV
jgi:hypothetical protein